MEVENTVCPHAAAATTKPEVSEVSEDEVEVAIAADEEKLENEDRGDEQAGAAVSVARDGEAVFVAKRKRGRPRKQRAWEALGQQFMVVPAYSPTPEKRGRGLPRGSGKWQTLAASLGGINTADTAGSDFTPYTITVQPGENIVQRIWSFSQMTPDSICILSASGTISSAEIFALASYGGGHFTIIYLNGSHTYDEKRGGKICLLSVQMANVDGRSYGGAVASSLIAAGPTQLIIATFKQKLRHQPNIRPHHFASPNPNREATVPVPPQTEKRTIDAKGKGTLVIDPPVVPDLPVTDPEVAMKGPESMSRAAPQPSSARAATPEAEGGFHVFRQTKWRSKTQFYQHAVAATAEPEVLEVSEDEVEVAVAANEKLKMRVGKMNKQGLQSALHAAESLCSWPREREGARENSGRGRHRDNRSWRCQYIPPRWRSEEEAALVANLGCFFM
ncbi:AT-hook motif nuclear-localized protein 11 [Sesamum alatum]|uniref:AT-hook motif nuclear-localized protein n=1 Tax=Sesamum alatum TaxID=300844 RepID=A0AAE2CHT2_9LAMI|nr:AT-hook motif nuclear-localized protein 11 [Sesamum alatum]